MADLVHRRRGFEPRSVESRDHDRDVVRPAGRIREINEALGGELGIRFFSDRLCDLFGLHEPGQPVAAENQHVVAPHA